MDTIHLFYAAAAVILTLVLIPIATMFAFVPFSALGALGKSFFGRGGADDAEAETLLHPRAMPDATGFYEEEELNRPFEKSA